MWICICNSCHACGGEVAFKIYDREPTDDDKEQIQYSIGGMFCITTVVKEIEEDEINFIKE